MSAGNPKVVVRLSESLLSRMRSELDKRNCCPTAELWTVSDWVRKAIEDKLDHAERSRKPRTK